MNDELFTKRVSIRTFDSREIPSALLESIIERALHAPTCGNMQLYSVIVTKDIERKKMLAKLHFNQPASTGCNVILTVCADFNLFTRWCELSGANPGYDNFHSFVMAFTDAVIFAQQIVTIAEGEGIGTCYLGTVNYTAKEISQLLELPDRVVPVASIAMGFPAEKPQPTDRLPLKAILHEELYRKDTDTTIKEYFSEKEALAENIAYIIENSKQSLAQVFTDIRYPKDVNEAVSKSFKSLIEEKGFKFL